MRSPNEFLREQSGLEPDQRLDELVQILRGPEGCPWDQKQTALSMVEYVIDEAHELKEALLHEPEKASEELGDLLFTLRFVQQAMGESGRLDTAVSGVVEKMIRRHPHVFDRANFDNESDIRKNWEAEKRREQPKLARLDDDLPASLAPLKRAQKVLGRATGAGFTYSSLEAAWDKVEEELEEFREALGGDDSAAMEEELGDLLLALLTVAKQKKLKAHDALSRAERKFCDRIARLEETAGRSLVDIPWEELGPLWRQVRQESSPTQAYFNYCGVSLWPRPVQHAVRRATRQIASRGLVPVLTLRQEREVLRTKIRRFVSASEADRVVYVSNISSAALAVAYAQPWDSGDRLLVGKSEFPANTVPWAVAANLFELDLHRFDDDLLRTAPEEGWLALEHQLATLKPRLMAISAVSFWSGFRVDLARLCELCQRHGTRLFVDGIQALGTVPIEMGGVDYLAAGSHKGLLAPEAAGFLVVSDCAAIDWQPRVASWLSLPDPVAFLVNGQQGQMPDDLLPPVAEPSTLEGGSANTIGYAGLDAAIEWLMGEGVENIFHHIQQLQDPLEAGFREAGWTSLRATDPNRRSAVLSFRPPEGVDLLGVHQSLGQAGVVTGTPNGCLRFGFHRANSQQDVERALAVLPTL